MAGGFPISEAVARQAAEWLTLLMSNEATDEDRRRWQQWRMAHPDHERAWQHIEAVTGRLKVMQPKAAYKALSPYTGPDAATSPRRRMVLRALLWAGGASTIGLLGSRTQTWQLAAADYRTGTGEQRSVTLDDGTVITLNTASAINVRFDGQRRLVRLVAGEILVVTGHAAGARADDARPFLIETAEGRIRALGTRFTVRQRDEHTQVAVLERAVEITPRDAAGQRRVLRAGERTSFTREAVEAPQTAGNQATAWANGQIVADDMRLGDFVAELGRYRPGILRCAPDVAGLRFSGVFPLQDTDRILSTLPNVLPVQVTLRTRYWVTVEAAR
ncbi:MAG: FecR domain-containing protein [Burkholderiaceae bacterium]|nr:FecR domain-containing protein [Burkholderiaceae bacterium]